MKSSNFIQSNREEYPESYRTNTEKEKLILTYVDNFRHQYHHIHSDRKPILLNPLNECQIQKFVCTTIRPTMLPYSDLIEWKSIANFVADHLNYDLLEPAHELPNVLFSPTKILSHQHGNCFDYANLLCSLLIGAGYDAYIVSGYATREICYMDTTRLQNPYIREYSNPSTVKEINQSRKYAVKSSKDLTSKYDAYMNQRHLDKIQEEKETIENEEKERINNIEKPLPDPLYGIRVHAWILILSGKRDISKEFFIEPTTGLSKATGDDQYLGIESIWNNENLWINIQDCSSGCQFIEFNLNDQSRWEPIFINSIAQHELMTTISNVDKNDRFLSNQIDWFSETAFFFTNPIDLPVSNINSISYYKNYPSEIKSEIYRKHYKSLIPDIKISNDIHSPSSWVERIDIKPQDFEKRYPNSYKRCFFKKTLVEKYAPYSMKNGIVRKISEFEDYFFQNMIFLTCHYEYRHDKLETREYDVRLEIVYETYRRGRNDRLKEYIYNYGRDIERTMIFYNKSRFDCLSKRYQTIDTLTDYFIDRDDLLECRKVVFECQTKPYRTIISITEKFARNLSLNTNDDIQEIVYNIKNEKFIITYHRNENNITQAIRIYTKPVNNDINENFHRIYQIDDDHQEMSTREHYHQYFKLIKNQDKIIKVIRKIEDEIRDFESLRYDEELVSDLDVSIYDIERNEKSKIYKQSTKKSQLSNQTDYLAPYLIALGNPERINNEITEQVKYLVKRDLKNSTISQANFIQTNYENSKRLEEHKQFSKEIYVELENKLSNDDRLKEPYLVR